MRLTASAKTPAGTSGRMMFRTTTIVAITVAMVTMLANPANALGYGAAGGTMGGADSGGVVTYASLQEVSHEGDGEVQMEFKADDTSDATCFDFFSCSTSDAVFDFWSPWVSQYWVGHQVGGYGAPFPWDTPHKVELSVTNCQTDNGDICFVSHAPFAEWGYEQRSPMCLPASHPVVCDGRLL